MEKPRYAAHHRLLFGRPKRARRSLLIWGALIALAVGIGWWAVMRELDWTAATRAIENLNPLAIVPLMAMLPVLGFPIVVVYVVAGARFGPWLGGAVVAFATAFHLIASHAVARSILRRPLQRWVARRHEPLPEVPEDEHALVAVIMALVPALPYVMRNYLLALAGVKLRTYFWICLPIYVARSYVSIMLGDLSSDPSRRQLLILFGIDLLKGAICALVLWRLREHHRRVHGREGASDAAPATDAAPK